MVTPARNNMTEYLNIGVLIVDIDKEDGAVKS